MYRIVFIESRESDQSALTEVYQGSALDDAIAHARLFIKKIELAPPPPPWHSDVIGFIIYDDSGQEVKREYLPDDK